MSIPFPEPHRQNTYLDIFWILLEEEDGWIDN